MRKVLDAAGAATIAAALLLAAGAARAEERKLTLLLSSPDLALPFSVHIMNKMREEAARLGNVDVVVSDGQRNSPKQSADIEAAIAKGVDGIVVSPNDGAALAPAIREAVGQGIPVVTVDRRIDGVEGVLGHVGADNVKGGEVQGELIAKLFPNGAKVMNLQGQPGTSAAIDRNKGLHDALDGKAGYTFVFEDTAGFDRAKALAMTESALGGLAGPPDVIAAANDDMALGAVEALRGRDLVGKVAVIGFDALPEALAQIRDGNLTGTIEQSPGAQGGRAVELLVTHLRTGRPPEAAVTLLTPLAVTRDNLADAERLGELK